MTRAELDLAEQLFNVFVRMKSEPEQFSDSGTARSLLEHDVEFFRARATAEFAELMGCIDGSHRHSDDFRVDFLLESSQVFYWLALAAIQSGQSFDEFIADKFAARELARLEKLHLENQISLSNIFEKDLAACRKKGYLLSQS